MTNVTEDEMFDAAVSWCDSNGINVLEPEQLASLVRSLFITVQDASLLQSPAMPVGELTDEQIDEIQQTWIAKGMNGSRSFARAILAAALTAGRQALEAT